MSESVTFHACSCVACDTCATRKREDDERRRVVVVWSGKELIAQYLQQEPLFTSDRCTVVKGLIDCLIRCVSEEESESMGATQSSSDSDDCQPCFFFKAPLAKKRSGERTAQDLMGSPLPPTPVHRRKQFQDAMDRDNQQNGVYSSKYFGLEKEVSGGGRGVDGSRSLAAVSTGGQAAPQHPPQAEVHEGPVRIV